MIIFVTKQCFKWLKVSAFTIHGWYFALFYPHLTKCHILQASQSAHHLLAPAESQVQQEPRADLTPPPPVTLLTSLLTAARALPLRSSTLKLPYDCIFNIFKTINMSKVIWCLMIFHTWEAGNTPPNSDCDAKNSKNSGCDENQKITHSNIHTILLVKILIIFFKQCLYMAMVWN